MAVVFHNNIEKNGPINNVNYSFRTPDGDISFFNTSGDLTFINVGTLPGSVPPPPAPIRIYGSGYWFNNNIGLKHDIIARIEPVTGNISIYQTNNDSGGDHFVVNLSFTWSDI